MRVRSLVGWLLCMGLFAAVQAGEVLWREGEESSASDFAPGAAPLAGEGGSGASAGMYLKLAAAPRAGEAPTPHFAEYAFTVDTLGDYRLWIASTPLHVGWASPFSVRWLDAGDAVDLAGKKHAGVPYGRGQNEQFFVWTDAGVRKFAQPGTYTLRVEADKPRASDNKVTVFLDALFLTRDMKFIPKGNKPPQSPLARVAAAPAGTVVWREAEIPDASNLDAKANVPFLTAKGEGASGGMYLHIDRPLDAEAAPDGYWAEYRVTIPAPGAYHFWVASTPLSVGWAAPYSVRWDDGPVVDLAGRRPTGPSYGLPRHESYFHWTKVGVQAFDRAGEHTLRVVADRPRASNAKNIRAYLDAFALVADPTWTPRGNRPPGSPWPGVSQEGSAEAVQQRFRDQYHAIQMKTYALKLSETREEWKPESADEVRRKLLARPLPDPATVRARFARFGVHGMEKSFVVAGVNDELTNPAYDLLARAGCEFLRTAESCWHRLGDSPAAFKWKDLDHQAAKADQYGMRLMLTVGYPAAQYTKGKTNKLSACLPEYYELYRDYLRSLFARVPRRVVHSVELANEVDAAHVWWVGDSTPADYAAEARMTREELDKAWPGVPFFGFGATWASVERDRAKGLGRAWVEAAFDAGVDRYFDGYSLHYTWSPTKWQFADWMRAERARRGFPEKPLANSEDSAYGHPGDVMKMFARNLFLQDLESVTYFLARDFQEKQNLLYSGLFDLDWQPKLRLLAFAASVDAMRDRKLVGLADPKDGLEGYVLEATGDAAGTSRYAMVLWALDRNEKGMHTVQRAPKAVRVDGLKGVREAVSWRLDSVPFEGGALSVGNEPVTVYADSLPEWKLLTPAEWRSRNAAAAVAGQDGGILPGQALPRAR